MHIPDGFVSGPVLITGGLAAAAAVGGSVWFTSRTLRRQPHQVPLLATTAAFVFAAQMLNFPIGIGTSGHFLGAAAVAALLGPWSACLVMTLVLIIQCLVFNDGGMTALGVNILNMGVVAVFVGYGTTRLLRALLPSGPRGYVLAAAGAAWISVLVASAACALELAVSGTSPMAFVMPAMLGAHAVIGIGEALITGAVLSAVVATRPDVLPRWSDVAAGGQEAVSKGRVRGLAVAGLILAVILATLVSPLASDFPDGLEKVAAEYGFIELAEGPAWWNHSVLPGYTTPGIEQAGVSTGLAGFAGTVAVFVVGFGAVKLFNAKSTEQES